MKKNLFIEVSEQVLLKLKHAQLHIKPTRVLNSIQGICVYARIIIKSVDRGLSIKEMFRKLYNQSQSSSLSKR